MIIDLQQTHGTVPVRSAEVCILGAGAAGITLAVDLARRGRSVLLLEAGGSKPEQDGQNLFATEITGFPHSGAIDGRARVLGGTTTLWGGQLLELDESDFHRRSWVDESGWPFPKSTLAPYYRRAFAIEGASECLPEDHSVWHALGTHPPKLDGGFEAFFTRSCPQPNFEKLYRDFLASHPRVTVYLHACVSEILLSPAQNAISAIRCFTDGCPDSLFTAAHFIFCLGGLETPRLLLQPLRGVNGLPWDRGGTLGRFFQDHLDISTATLTPHNRRAFHLQFDNVYLDGFRYIPKIKASATLQERHQILAVGASLNPLSRRHNRYQRRNPQAPNKNELRQALRAPGLLVRKGWRYCVHRRAYNPDELGIDLRVHCEQAPNSNSRITLSRERDTSGMFRLQIDWCFGELELKTIREFTHCVTRVLEGSGIASSQVHHNRFACTSSLAKHATDTYHHMGATRMASSPSRGVVDPDCRLFGIVNGFVCSSSVFPSSGFSNPTHTILALAMRLAEHLATRSTL